MKIAIGCDHGGINLKAACIEAVESLGHTYVDFGTYTTDSVDYPDYAVKVAQAVQSGECDKGILLCGTGIGIGIVANKFKGIRCAHVTDAFCAQMCAEHNDANVISMGGRITTPEDAGKFVRIYLTTPFAGGRHAGRVGKITAVEEKNFK